jgi:2-amino-4-hydroxy-6-hydroxymethyldihydropteridine diphosphokinase
MTPGADFVLLSLGANLGNREQTLRTAAELLGKVLAEAACSSLYETDPVGYTDQPPFVNCAVRGLYAGTPEELFLYCKQIETRLGRRPRARWHEREIDIDIVVFGSLHLQSDILQIPHPRAFERAFVLVPAAEIAPEAEVPGLGPVAELLARVDTSRVRRL